MANIITEISRIKEIMGLITESSKPITGAFNLDKFLTDKNLTDATIPKWDLKLGNTEIKTFVDLEDVLSDIKTKKFDDLSNEESAFLKDLNEKLFDEKDIAEMVSKLKTEFEQIKGDDAAVLEFYNDMEKIFGDKQMDDLRKGLVPNNYLRLDTETLKGMKDARLKEISQKDPNNDDVNFLNALDERNLITPTELEFALKNRPGFVSTWKIYDDFLKKKKMDETLTFDKYLESLKEKNPNLFIKYPAQLLRKISLPWQKFGQGVLDGNTKLMWEGFKGMALQTLVYGGIPTLYYSTVSVTDVLDYTGEKAKELSQIIKQKTGKDSTTTAPVQQSNSQTQQSNSQTQQQSKRKPLTADDI